ncbi:MAG: DNA mismatch repair endonuclease MutL [Endomicrobium sp.]|jgi:DNA mismatch repair protein MutL|nr:DNA mismatch repair endonuclease MutL [Endomicrobium sp.]
MPINILSQETINKIAAGEVIECPLNVVKELVENSLDALASSIVVEIENSGKKLIRVADNGLGMSKKDLELSILRHTTSKIEKFTDLSYIYSFGFRGEALASIATVSNLKIKTKRKMDVLGWELLSHGGKNIKTFPWSGADGTISEVRNLFFNTPARYKFLASNLNERIKIINSLEEIALANYDVTFKLISEKKNILSTVKTNNKINRILDILGKDFTKSIKNIKINQRDILMNIYFTDRYNSLSSKKYQYLFINSRPVNYPKSIIRCIYQAYRESIQNNKHPGILIYMAINPSEIDFNIHPTKREIKFANENEICDIILKVLRNTLVSQSCSNINITSSYNDSYKSTLDYNSENSFSDNYDDFFSDKQINFGYRNFNGIKIIGQIFNTYIVVENIGYFYIFDQHAVSERIKYELYISQMKAQDIKTQRMLTPLNFDIPLSSLELVKANMNIFNELGMILEEFGHNSLRVIAYPELLGNISIEHVIKTIISNIENDKNTVIEQKRDKIMRLACHASIKSGYKVSFIEAEKLISDLFKCEYPFTCPHGRPTAYKISLHTLEKFFRRK